MCKFKPPAPPVRGMGDTSSMMADMKEEPESPDFGCYIEQIGSPAGTGGGHNSHSGNESAANGTTDSKKKRIGKACDSCRIKKCRCDGRKPCSKCTADNKICVYSERKKPRDKVYPSGYVELLETRLDLLTKSLEKLVDISSGGTSLAVFKQAGHKFNVNNLINQLVSEHGLLDNQPVEWDTATRLAAQLPDDADGIAQISSVYAEHARALSSAHESAALAKMKDRAERKKGRAHAHAHAHAQQHQHAAAAAAALPRHAGRSPASPDALTNSANSADPADSIASTGHDSHSFNDVIEPHKNGRGSRSHSRPDNSSAAVDKYPLDIKTEFDEELDALKTDFSLQGFKTVDGQDEFTRALDLGPFSSGAAIAAAAMEGGLSMSDFESDNARTGSNYSSVASNSPFDENDWSSQAVFGPHDGSGVGVASSLFLDTGRAASTHDLLTGSSAAQTSLNSALFNENPPASSVHVTPGSPRIEPQLRRSNSRPYSLSSTPSGKKLVNNHSGQIAKPHHHGHQRTNSFNNPLRRTHSNSNSNSALQSPSPDNSSSLQSPDAVGVQPAPEAELNLLDMISLSPNNPTMGNTTANANPNAATNANASFNADSDTIDNLWAAPPT